MFIDCIKCAPRPHTVDQMGTFIVFGIHNTKLYTLDVIYLSYIVNLVYVNLVNAHTWSTLYTIACVLHVCCLRFELQSRFSIIAFTHYMCV